MTPLVLSGVKHCGKTTHGKLLAERLARPFVDTDETIQQLHFHRFGQRLGCREIMARYGESFFREQEAEAIFQLIDEDGPARVFALGGGVPANPLLAAGTLKRLGFVVYLEIAPEIAFARIKRGGLPPFLQTSDPEASFRALYAQRDVFYRTGADLVFSIRKEQAAQEVFDDLFHTLQKTLGDAL